MFAEGERVEGFDGIGRKADLSFGRLGAALRLDDVAVLPGGRIEVLKADHKGMKGPADIEIVD